MQKVFIQYCFRLQIIFSEDDQKYLFDTKFTDEFIDDIKNDPKKAYEVLNEIVQNIEDGKTDRISKMFKNYADKIYMMKNMLKDYCGFQSVLEVICK